MTFPGGTGTMHVVVMRIKRNNGGSVIVLCILVGFNRRESTSVEAKTGAHYAF